jgi:hypothetical protein
VCIGPEKVKACYSAPGGITSYDDHNEDRAQAAEVNAAYMEKTKPFTRWLADNGYRILSRVTTCIRTPCPAKPKLP